MQKAVLFKDQTTQIILLQKAFRVYGVSYFCVFRLLGTTYKGLLVKEPGNDASYLSTFLFLL